MEHITEDELTELTSSFKRSIVHLETRDAYGTETELPHMARWAAVEPDDFEWLHGVFTPIAEAGEDVRWVPRRSVSTVCIPGNDYYLFDDERVVFLHYAGSGLNTAFTTTSDPNVIEMCSTAFEKVWTLSIPHSEYKPD